MEQKEYVIEFKGDDQNKYIDKGAYQVVSDALLTPDAKFVSLDGDIISISSIKRVRKTSDYNKEQDINFV